MRSREAAGERGLDLGIRRSSCGGGVRRDRIGRCQLTEGGRALDGLGA
jgi:hypothetical protein